LHHERYPNTRRRFFGIKDVRGKEPSGGITLVEQLTLYPKIKGYNPNAGTRNEPLTPEEEFFDI
jgi:hypothetical protein